MPKKRANARKSKKSSFLVKLQLLIGLILVFAAFVLLGSIKVDQYFKKSILANKEQDSSSVNVRTVKASHLFTGKSNPADLPEQIVIPSLNVNAKITESQITDGYWEVSETTANHGVGSAYPGEKGNLVVFAHVREGLFLNLRLAKEGDQIYILTKNKWYKYKITEIKRVAPDQIDVVKPTNDERLTLFTCDGYQDEKRLIVVAKPVKEG